MRFEFGGRTYLLEFQREHKDVHSIHNGEMTTVKSKYPYTTATLFLVEEAPKDGKFRKTSEVLKATVGCLHTDKYSNSAGRLFALRALTSKLRRTKWDKEFRAALWQAYVNRGKKPVAQEAQGEIIDAVATRVQEGPPQPLTVADTENLDGRIIH